MNDYLGVPVPQFPMVEYVHVERVEEMAPFLMSVASASDGWLFLGSNGGLAAGRVSSEGAMFPYRNADQLLSNRCGGGLWAAVLFDSGDRVWLPFCEEPVESGITRAVSKHRSGGVIRLMERNFEAGLSLSWEVGFGRKRGLIKRTSLANVGDVERAILIVEGWRTILPPEMPDGLYTRMSYLAQAYMRHEATLPQVAVYSLNVGISDRPEPYEVMRYAVGVVPKAPDVLLLSDRQIRDILFRRIKPRGESEERGVPGAHLLVWELKLLPGDSVEWWASLDTGLDHCQLEEIRCATEAGLLTEEVLKKDLIAGVWDLEELIARVDGWQVSGDGKFAPHYAMNCLYNSMRGGMPACGNRIPDADFEKFLGERNKACVARLRGERILLAGTLGELRAVAKASGDADLERIAGEYLPLTFGRRHGDPSRPWNRFEIVVRDKSGRPVMNYEGNWRDIFQNWEALAWSYPELLPAMVFTFLNSTTADGYNPYRIQRVGFEWEVLDVADPWSNIGYWGDHQIVYLTRLLDLYERFFPGQLAERLGDETFVFADVPYRIRKFESILRNPRQSIDFDWRRHEVLTARAKVEGADGKLLRSGDGKILRASLAEKLLIPVLVKFASHIPGGGIWMNTQRPEWNDANNALAGFGLSVVTAAYFHRHVVLLRKLFEGGGRFALHTATLTFLEKLEGLKGCAADVADPGARMQFMQAAGLASETHREKCYRGDLGGKEVIGGVRVVEFLSNVASSLRRTLEASRREDGLFHSYNILHFEGREARFENLNLMLEGQVAAVSSGALNPGEVVSLLGVLRKSRLYRADQDSYMLTELKFPVPVGKRNIIPEPIPKVFGELARLGCEEIAKQDVAGRWRFSSGIRNDRDLAGRLEFLSGNPELAGLISRERDEILRVWEEVFRHRQFTGRSEGIFAFEGIGCIYWHMVGKLLVAVGEAFREAGEGTIESQGLADAYHGIRNGLGFMKTAKEFGAIPCDPYSHTPLHCGAQQPGMTGLVKEEILARLMELGVTCEKGRLAFSPGKLLTRKEFCSSGAELRLQGDRRIKIPEGQIAFTLMGVPVIYHLGKHSGMEVNFSNGRSRLGRNYELTLDETASMISRDGKVENIRVGVDPALLWQ